MEVAELLTLLESNQPDVVEDIKKKFHELCHSCNSNESWLVNGLVDHSVQTGSLRTLDILVGVREPHDNHLFNKFSETLRTSNKLQALSLLGHIVRRQPTWLFKITRHSLFKDLLKLLKTEVEILPLMSALLVINILLPMVAGLMEPHIQELFHIFSHLAVWDTVNPNRLSEGHLLHLQMALYALFLRLYGMYPCNFISYLRQEYSQPSKLSIFSHTIKPMLDNVKIHPLLITASKDTEVTTIRWRKMEPHDVIVECAKYAVGGEYDRGRDEGSTHTSPDFINIVDNKYLSRSASVTEKDIWSPTSYCGMSTPPESAPTSIPHTPIAQTHIISSCFPQQEGTSPPEAAVEATPETTPIKDTRRLVRSGPPLISNVPRALNTFGTSPNHSQPSSPLKKEVPLFRFPSNLESSAFHQPNQDRKDSLTSQKVQRIINERVQITTENADSKSMKLRGPSSPLRVINNPSWGCESPADQEDREVESMMTADNNSRVWDSRQCDSVVQDIITIDHDDLEECHKESCTAGGLCMPNSDSIRDFTCQVRKRLRYFSQCQGMSIGSSSIESASVANTAKVRRTNSCPEMKKSCSSVDRHPVEKVDEEPSTLNGQNMDNTLVTSTGTQTDNPLPYEHLFLAVFPPVEHSHHHDMPSEKGLSSPLPVKRCSSLNQVDAFMSALRSDIIKTKSQGIEAELKVCKEHLFLMGLQLHFENHRREMHAERNRRLLGKCRKVRSQEELTSALKDQVSLLHKHNDLLHADLHKRADETRNQLLQLQETVSHYQNQNISLQSEYAKEKLLRESVEQLLKQEREKTANVTKEFQETKACLFNTTNELQQAATMATEGRELRESIQRLQREIVIGGEVQERYRHRVNSLLSHIQQSSEVSILLESSSQQINALNEALEAQTATLEALRSRVGELDTIIMKRESTAAESKRLLQEAQDEFHEQLEATEMKYNSLKAVNSRLEGEVLELKHRVDTCSSSSPTLVLPVANTQPCLSLHALVHTDLNG